MASKPLFTMNDDVFEITDFTTASDWERFVSDLEEVITQWQLCGKESTSVVTADHVTNGVWTQKQEKIRFSKTTFSLVFHKLQETEECVESEDNTQTVVCPQSAVDGQRVEMDWPPKSHCLVRYFGMRCFVVLRAEGINNEDRMRLVLSSLSMALNSTQCSTPFLIQSNASTYSGLALNDSTRVDYQTIVCARSEHKFKFLSSLLDLFRAEVGDRETTIQVSIRLTFVLREFPSDLSQTSEEFLKLNLNENEDPVLELQLASIWSHLAEDAVIDSENHSDLDPNCAEKWTLRAVFKENEELSENLFLLLSLKENKKEIFEKIIEKEKQLKDAFIPLTDDSVRQKSIRKRIREQVFSDKPIDEEIELSLNCAPFGSLGWKIALLLTEVYCEERSLEDLSFAWREIVQRVRQNWETCRPLPHCCGRPDLNFGLLYQKLQMINTCIVDKQKDQKDSDEEFFDANEDCVESGEGRKERSHLMRVSDPREYIWIPETQETPPLTEDMLSEQLTVLQQLGTSHESQLMRAKLQTSGLLSDMESFKASNPLSSFEDFIRWHSPRDCDENGILSPRFQTQNNVWRELWTNARSICAKKQKPLFDFNKEAEKVIHYMTSLTFSDLAELVVPIIIDCYVLEIKEKQKLLEIIDLNESHVILCSQQKNFESVLHSIREQMIKIQRFESLLRKFQFFEIPFEKTIIEKLVTQPEVQIQSFGKNSDLLREMFGKRLKEEPKAKEFILRVWSPRPSLYSRRVPHRMYCLWSPRETRLSTALSQDLTYF